MERETDRTSDKTAPEGKSITPLAPPEKVTIPWLVQHVDIKTWLLFAGLIVTSFLTGISAGQTALVQELLAKKNGLTQNPKIPNSSDGSASSQGTAAADTGNKALSQQKSELNTQKLSNPTPSQIADAIAKAPPLQRKDIARRYEGIKVDWELFFDHARELQNDFVVVLLAEDPRGMTVIRCVVQLSEYRELGVMPRGKSVRVTGTISSAEDVMFLDLKDVKLFY